MAIDFYDKEISSYESTHLKPYVGFFTPSGRLVDFNTELGGSHSDLGNIVSWTYLLWIKNSKCFEDVGIRDIKMNASIDMESGIIDNANMPSHEYNERTNLLLLQRDLLLFLKQAENSPEFISKIRSIIHDEDLPEYIKRDKRLPMIGESFYEIESVFGLKNTRSLLLFLKDICTRYLGYDSIEKYKPNNELLTFDESTYSIIDKPRKITTPSNNIHKRFFNYLLMDWEIKKVPRLIYNDSTCMFEEEPSEGYSIQSDSDEVYEKELTAIKKMVPLKYRMKYFI